MTPILLLPTLVLAVADPIVDPIVAVDAGPTPEDALQALAAHISHSVYRLAEFSGDDQVGNGTGFCVRDGVLATNHHVVAHIDGDFFAIDEAGQRHVVRGLLADDEDHDIALVAIDGSCAPLELAGHDDFRVGDPVMLVGSSHGLDLSVGVGVIAAIRPGFPEDIVKEEKRAHRKTTQGPFVQHTATAAPGSSGSPVVDARGHVVAVHHSGLHDSPIYFGAHVDLLRALMAHTDLNAAPKTIGSTVTRNLLISLAVFAGLAVVVAVALRIGPWLSARRRRSRRVVGRA